MRISYGKVKRRPSWISGERTSLSQRNIFWKRQTFESTQRWDPVIIVEAIQCRERLLGIEKQPIDFRGKTQLVFERERVSIFGTADSESWEGRHD